MNYETAQGVSEAPRDARALIRRADRIPQVQRALFPARAAGTLGSSPLRRRVLEYLEADGPATCLI